MKAQLHKKAKSTLKRKFGKKRELRQTCTSVLFIFF